MNKSPRDALTALRDFAETARRRCAANLELFAKPKGALFDPSSKIAPFPAQELTAAQSFTDETGEGFVLLGHLDGPDVEFAETEALIWLANDAVTFDKLANADERVRPLAQMHGERAVARAIYLKALLGGYLRALDADLLQQALGGDEKIAQKAAQLAQPSVDEFIAGMEAMLAKARFRPELSAFAQAAVFPTLPMAVGHKKSNWEVLHGVALTNDMADQWRAGRARQRPPKQGK